MEYQHIQYEVDEQILTITLNRPDRMNAFTLRMKDELVHAFDQASNDDQIRAVIVTGAGRAFCAGMEMEPEEGGNLFGYNEPQPDSLEQVEAIRDSGGEVSLAIYNCKKPVIGALNGAAVGVGITMTLPMDFRIAVEGGKIGFVFGLRGVTPEACSSWFLPRLVGMSQALEWVFSGEIFKAEEGLKAGLFRDVVSRDELITSARALAKKLTANTSPVSTAFARQLMWRNQGLPHPMQAHCIESRVIYLASEQFDGRDGFQSFLEKREPVFEASVAESVQTEYPWWPAPKLD